MLSNIVSRKKIFCTTFAKIKGFSQEVSPKDNTPKKCNFLDGMFNIFIKPKQNTAFVTTLYSYTLSLMSKLKYKVSREICKKKLFLSCHLSVKSNQMLRGIKLLYSSEIM